MEVIRVQKEKGTITNCIGDLDLLEMVALYAIVVLYILRLYYLPIPLR